MSGVRRGGRTAPGLKPGHVKLERALSKLGLASRTEARALIESGKVRVDGRLVTDPTRAVVPERVRLEIEGKGAVTTLAARTIAFHKPRGLVTTRKDERGRATVYSVLGAENQQLMPVGRLDLATSGLLLFTNDTRLSDWLTEPANGVRRVYVVTVSGEVSAATVAKLTAGVRDEGELLRADAARAIKVSRRESRLELVLSEGKNREIRRLFLALGHEVSRLVRVSYGGIALGELAVGAHRELSVLELKAAFPGAPVRPELGKML